jgi:hypothetical protein
LRVDRFAAGAAGLHPAGHRPDALPLRRPMPRRAAHYFDQITAPCVFDGPSMARASAPTVRYLENVGSQFLSLRHRLAIQLFSQPRIRRRSSISAPLSAQGCGPGNAPSVPTLFSVSPLFSGAVDSWRLVRKSNFEWSQRLRNALTADSWRHNRFWKSNSVPTPRPFRDNQSLEIGKIGPRKNGRWCPRAGLNSLEASAQ